MNQANTKVSAYKVSSTTTKAAENGTKSTSSETAVYMKDNPGKSCERPSRKGNDDIGECIKIISETFKIVDDSERKRSPSREKAPKVPMNGISVEEKSYARCTRSRAQKILHPSKETTTLKPEVKRRSPSREKAPKVPMNGISVEEKSYARCTKSRAQKILHPSKETNSTLKPEIRRRSPSREKRQKSPTPSDNISREKKAYNKNTAKHKVQITKETKQDAVKSTKNLPHPAGKFSPTKTQRLSERLTAHTESSKKKLRNPNVYYITSNVSDLQDEEKTAVKRNEEESQHSVRVFEKSESTHSAREKREVSVKNTKKSQSSVAKKEVVEVTFSKAEVSESFTSSSSTVKTNASGANISHLLKGAQMGFELLDDESMPVIMNGTNIDIDNLEGTDVDFEPGNKGKNESGMNSSSKIPRKAQANQSGMKCNATMMKETTVSFDSGCEDIQL